MCYQVPDKSHLMQQIPTFVWICQTQTPEAWGGGLF